MAATITPTAAAELVTYAERKAWKRTATYEEVLAYRARRREIVAAARERELEAEYAQQWA